MKTETIKRRPSNEPIYRKNHYLMSIDGGTGDKDAKISADFFDKYYNEGVVYGDFYIGSLLPTLPAHKGKN